jgi:hypothetical protein
VKPRGAKPVRPDALRAAKLTHLGVTLADALERYQVTKAELGRARKAAPRPTLAERALAALSDYGRESSGALAEHLDGIASWLSYIDKATYGADDVRALLAECVTAGLLAIDGDRWTLPRPWP